MRGHMELNMDTIKDILLQVAALKPGDTYRESEDWERAEHAKLLVEDEYCEGVIRVLGHGFPVVDVQRLTTAGYELLDHIKDDANRKALQGRHRKGSFGLDALKAILESKRT